MNSEIDDEITVVPEKTEKMLTPQQVVDYRDYRESLLRWLLNLGKKPEKAEGYSKGTVKVRAYRMDKFMCRVWEE
jgi:hypothetical protein